MKHRIFYFIGIVILSSLAVACANSTYQEVPLEEKLAQRGYAIGEPVKRINDYQINSWNSVDRKHVIINFGASRNYLVTLRTSCDGLLDATLLSFSTTVGFLTDKDKLLVRDGGNHLLQCYIQTIHELEKVKRPG
jgi:hypothetical protein